MINKVTPIYDVTWYVKWIATVLLLIGVSCRSAGLNPIWDFSFCIIGEFGWLYVAYKWHDRALIVVNTVLSVILLTGFLKLLGEMI